MILPGMNWTRDIDALTAQITEIDMQNAGMSVICEDGLLHMDDIRELEAMPKGERAVAVGKMSRALSRVQRGVSLSELVTRGIQRRVEEMLVMNGIGIDRILSVKRDAVFITGPPPSLLALPGVTKFRAKSSWTAFAKFGAVELYCVPGRGRWDLKGVADARRAAHGPFVVRFAMDVLGLAERGELIEAAATVVRFRSDYVARRLPLGFYRELNATSSFCIQSGSTRFLIDGLESSFSKEELDVSHNAKHVIVPLARALA